MLVAILVICGAATVRAQYPGPFLTDEIRPNGILFLPVPPDNVKDSIGGKFYNDWWYYQWGKSVRDDYAVMDEDVELLSDQEEGVFNDIIGLEPGEKAPEILRLAQAATSDVHRASKLLKNHYQCLRPFAFFGEPSITPDKDEELAREWGYPSGHSARGWMFAYVLSQIAPDRANDLALRAYAYQKQLKKARKEYQRVKRQVSVQNDSTRSHTIGYRYDLLSRHLRSAIK